MIFNQIKVSTTVEQEERNYNLWSSVSRGWLLDKEQSSQAYQGIKAIDEINMAEVLEGAVAAPTEEPPKDQEEWSDLVKEILNESWVLRKKLNDSSNTAKSSENKSQEDVAANDEEKSPAKKSVKDVYDPVISQQKRRLDMLAAQKGRRDEMLDRIRGLEGDSGYGDDLEGEAEQDFSKWIDSRNSQIRGNVDPEMELERAADEPFPLDEMDTNAFGKKGMENVKPHSSQKGRGDRRWNNNKGGGRAPCRVMMSEWLTERPDDLEDKWMGVFCPMGKRCLVVASRGKTKVYSRTNEFLGSFGSLLPGGGKQKRSGGSCRKETNGVTILDCIWSEKQSVFFVLDLICWASHSYYNCDKGFRQYFQTSKFIENPTLMEVSSFQPYPFLPLPAFECGQMAEVMMNSLPIFKGNVDGLLLFHKDSFYMTCKNPLCLWIYVNDVEEKLGVSVAPELLAFQQEHKRPPPFKKFGNNNETRNMETDLM